MKTTRGLILTSTYYGKCVRNCPMEAITIDIKGTNGFIMVKIALVAACAR
jgi:hypothetical protein